MLDPIKINYIEMPAKNVAITVEFFSDVFGWRFIDYGPDYVAIENAGIDGGFFKSDQSSSTRNGSALVVLYSPNLNQTKKKIVPAGGEIIQETFSFPGGFRFHFADPNGNEFAVWSEVDS